MADPVPPFRQKTPGRCICVSSPPGFVGSDGIHCGGCGGHFLYGKSCPTHGWKAKPRPVSRTHYVGDQCPGSHRDDSAQAKAEDGPDASASRPIAVGEDGSPAANRAEPAFCRAHDTHGNESGTCCGCHYECGELAEAAVHTDPNHKKFHTFTPDLPQPQAEPTPSARCEACVLLWPNWTKGHTNFGRIAQEQHDRVRARVSELEQRVRDVAAGGKLGCDNRCVELEHQLADLKARAEAAEAWEWLIQVLAAPPIHSTSDGMAREYYELHKQVRAQLARAARKEGE